MDPPPSALILRNWSSLLAVVPRCTHYAQALRYGNTHMAACRYAGVAKGYGKGAGSPIDGGCAGVGGIATAEMPTSMHFFPAVRASASKNTKPALNSTHGGTRSERNPL